MQTDAGLGDTLGTSWGTSTDNFRRFKGKTVSEGIGTHFSPAAQVPPAPGHAIENAVRAVRGQAAIPGPPPPWAPWFPNSWKPKETEITLETEWENGKK